MAELNIDKIARDIADEIKQELINSGAFIGRWIPVTKRLPEDFQRVLVTVERYNGDKVARVAEYNGRQRKFIIKENHEEWEVGEKGLLAWTPLPEPYTAKSEVEKWQEKKQ